MSQENLASKTITIPANNRVFLPVSGNFIACLESEAPFTIAMNHANPFYFRRGMSISPETPYYALELINNTVSDNEVTILYGFGRFTYADVAAVAATITGSLPLPTGAATEVTLAALEAKDFATQTTLAALLTELQAKADLAETQPVSAASLPLPTGAATQTTLASLLAEIQNERETASPAQLTAAATQAEAGLLTVKSKHTIQIDLALNASTSVDVMPQGTVDGVSWFDLESSNITLSASGTTHKTYTLPLADIRLDFVSETGGTGATLDIHFASVK